MDSALTLLTTLNVRAFEKMKKTYLRRPLEIILKNQMNTYISLDSFQVLMIYQRTPSSIFKLLKNASMKN